MTQSGSPATKGGPAATPRESPQTSSREDPGGGPAAPLGFLVKEDIKRLISAQHVFQDPDERDTHEEKQVGAWSYDLRLGTEAFISSEKQVRDLKKWESIVIQPGEFALATTWEWLEMPLKYVAFISLRFQYALKGLVNISGFHVDPGFSGHLVFSVYNAGPNPVVMRCGDPVFMIIFYELTKAAPPPDARDSKGLGRPPEALFRQIHRLKAEWVSSVMGPPISLVRLDRRVTRLTQTVSVLIALVVALVSTVVVAILLQRIP